MQRPAKPSPSGARGFESRTLRGATLAAGKGVQAARSQTFVPLGPRVVGSRTRAVTPRARTSWLGRAGASAVGA